MEAAYRRVAGKRRQREWSQSRGERRRLVQLAVSLGLFLLVFLGRGVFPGQSAAWGEMLAADTDFKAAFQQLRDDLAAQEGLGAAMGELLRTAFGLESEGPTPSTVPNEPPAVAVTLLGQTAGHGLDYYREYGLRPAQEPAPEPQVSTPPEPVAEPEPEPELVTAVAQAFNAAGEALPSNVSYEYYELGLEKTVAPVVGTVTSQFAYRTSPITGKREFHLALDIGAAQGTPIGAFADGVVRYIGKSDEFGLYFMIDHDNGVSTFYAHCSKLLVSKGDTVTCGETVALVGSTGNATGPHLHFTLLKDNIRLDPAYYVDLS